MAFSLSRVCVAAMTIDAESRFWEGVYIGEEKDKGRKDGRGRIGVIVLDSEGASGRIIGS